MADSRFFWRIERGDASTWCWFCPDGKSSGAFHSLSAALKDADRTGFLSASEYWAVTVDGRTTHFRPGRGGVNLPSGEMPKD
jgi:hypothetical protein